jgi:signal transduction histidine kinase
VVRSLRMTEQAGSKRTAAENLAELTTDIHRNTTFLLFSLGREYPDRIIQPKNELSSDAVRVAIVKWNDTPFGGDLYDKGITFQLNGDTYHLISKRQTLAEKTYELVALTNIDRTVSAEYQTSAIALTILILLMSGAILPTLLSLTISVKATDESVRNSKVQPKAFWSKEVTRLWENIKGYKAETHLYKIQIDQSTSGQMIVRSRGIEEAIIYNSNIALSSISGYTQEELEGQPLNMIVPEQYHHFHKGLGVFDDIKKRRVGMAAYAEGCPFHGDKTSTIVGRDRTVDLLHKDGSIRKVVLGVYYVGETDGVDEWVGVVTDVTDLTQAIAKAESYSQEIESVSRIFAHDLKADVIASAKAGEFVSETATELIDFLSSEGAIDADVKEFLEFIEKFSKRITLACQNAFALIDQRNKLHNLKERIEQIPQPITSIFESIESAFTSSDGTLTVNNACPINATAIVDNALFLSVIKNLIKNSFVHNNSETKKVDFRAEAQGDQIKFTIKDNGVGFPPAYLTDWGRVQGKAARLNTETEGSGVGLYSVRQIIDAHVGASIIIESDLGFGSVFTIIVRGEG